MNLHANKDFRIVVITNGWVLAGEYSREGDQVILEQSSCPERWGTTAGIGQLALTGVTSDSVIRPTGRASVPLNSVLFTLEVTPAAAATWPC